MSILESIQAFFVGVAVFLTALLGGNSLGVVETPLEQIDRLQISYFAANGEYLQIFCDGTLPSFKNETIRSKLGENVPEGYCVQIHKAPESRGGGRSYTVRWEDSSGYYARGSKTDVGNYTILKPLDPHKGDIATTT